MRRLQDLAVSADPDSATWDDAADRVEALVALLAPFEAAEGVGPANRVVELPGGASIASIVTMGSIKNLGLEPGKKVTAIVKASQVILAVAK